MAKRIVFVTGTRADFGKLKSLMLKVQNDLAFDLHVFVTGMHMLAKYGYTCEEVERAGFKNIHKYINQNASDRMDHILAKTISGLSDYVREINPRLMIIHGDRVEALAGAAVGALNNLPVGHVEGGEVSGTVDESIRHAVSKLSHIHFVANEAAKLRLIQLGEREESVYVIGSPDVDVASSAALPSLAEVKRHYNFQFGSYGILLFHPVVSEIAELRRQARVVVDALIRSSLNYVVIYPNNDHGTEIILEEYDRFKGKSNFKIYPSIRFEYFLTLMKEAVFMVGNSSAGVREAPHFGLPSINLGTRQQNRADCATIINTGFDTAAILDAIDAARTMPRSTFSMFGNGRSADLFHRVLASEVFWRHPIQKSFVDLR